MASPTPVFARCLSPTKTGGPARAAPVTAECQNQSESSKSASSPSPSTSSIGYAASSATNMNTPGMSGGCGGSASLGFPEAGGWTSARSNRVGYAPRSRRFCAGATTPATDPAASSLHTSGSKNSPKKILSSELNSPSHTVNAEPVRSPRQGHRPQRKRTDQDASIHHKPKGTHVRVHSGPQPNNRSSSRLWINLRLWITPGAATTVTIRWRPTSPGPVAGHGRSAGQTTAAAPFRRRDGCPGGPR
ncbi:MAG: hypothetical protein JWR37_20 [Mycobacterium sp.]|nr:hypothetical protein [Mycobacterium sp.]